MIKLDYVYKLKPDAKLWCVTIQEVVKFVNQRYVLVTHESYDSLVYFGTLCDNKFGKNATCEIEFTKNDIMDDVCYESVNEMLDKENKTPVDYRKRFDTFDIDDISNNDKLML